MSVETAAIALAAHPLVAEVRMRLADGARSGRLEALLVPNPADADAEIGNRGKTPGGCRLRRAGRGSG
jgi:hypothetical protein